MYKKKLRSQTKNKSKNMNKSMSTAKNMEITNSPAQNRQTSSTDTPKLNRLTNIQSACSSNIESPFKFVQMIDRRFEKLSEQLQNTLKDMFREYENRLLDEIDKRLNIAKLDLDNLRERVVVLETTINDLRNKSTAKVIKLSEEAEILKNEIAHLKDVSRKQENLMVANDIRIVGIPEQENENLCDLFSKICNFVKIQPPEIKSAFRIKSRSLHKRNNLNQNRSRLDSPIVIKLQSPYDRNYVLRSVRSNIKARKDVLRLDNI